MRLQRPLDQLAAPLGGTGIPTEDPNRALQFCQALAQVLAAPQGPLTQPARPVLSVVIPVYEEQDNLPALHARLTQVLSATEPHYEIIFIDDGSRDRSAEIMHSLALSDPHVVVVELSRNFGHQVAISAGLDYAQGDGVIIMDADLQDPPEVLPQFIAKWREGHAVVYAIREQRKEGRLKRALYALFYQMLQRVANIHIPLDAGDFCIMDRQVVAILNGMPERNRFVRGIRSWVGLDQVGLTYERQARYSGQAKYSYRRLIYLALDGLVSFSFVPLRMITIMGFIVSLISIVLAAIYFVQRLTVGPNPLGFTTTIVAVLFLSGMQLITLGVIGEYIGRIFEEVKRRPLYVVRRVTGKQPQAAAGR
ncbi:polyisoprenyl-phosphate glycosyltransferase [Thermoflexales bacterium]|nr:polyisoprenyl-phosphate glycosyltransferase [Thermoflexales bacterium]